MKIRVTAVLTIAAIGLLTIIPHRVLGQGEKRPFVLESGKYRMTAVFRFSDKDTDQKLESVHDLTIKKDGTVTIVDPKQPDLPIIGKLEMANFTARLDDAAGKVRLDGKLTGDNQLTGTLSGTHRDGKTTVKGTFQFMRIDGKMP